MENAVKALEYAFAILMFIIALSASMYLLSKAKEASDNSFMYVDTKHFSEAVMLPADELESGNIKYNGRIVNVETIVPTLYRDYKENYVIEFYDINNRKILQFDLSEENKSKQLWTGNPDIDVKKRLDLFLQGAPKNGKGIINNQEHDLNKDIAFVKNQSGKDVIVSNDKNSIVKNGLYAYCIGKKFVEEYGYVPKTASGSINESITKIVIRYKEVK